MSYFSLESDLKTDILCQGQKASPRFRQLTNLAFLLQAKSGLPVVQSTMSLNEAVQCNEKSLEPRRAQRGDYWVLYNYVPMSIAVRCWESVTYTTHADYTFLDNLEPLLERWRAPISIAMHAPGTDFAATLDAIKYSRNCGSSLVSQLVTFHVFFSSKHVPKMVSINDFLPFCTLFMSYLLDRLVLHLL